MTKPGNNIEMVNRQIDRLVEVLDACADAVLRFLRFVLECLEKKTFVRRQVAAQPLLYTSFGKKL